MPMDHLRGVAAVDHLHDDRSVFLHSQQWSVDLAVVSHSAQIAARRKLQAGGGDLQPVIGRRPILRQHRQWDRGSLDAGQLQHLTPGSHPPRLPLCFTAQSIYFAWQSHGRATAIVGETPTHGLVHTDAATPRGRRFVKDLSVLFLGFGSDLAHKHTGSGPPAAERRSKPDVQHEGALARRQVHAMQLYSDLFDSMMDCWDRIGFQHGLVYTAAMTALGLGFCLNLLGIVDLLWALGVLENPYRGAGTLHPQH